MKYLILPNGSVKSPCTLCQTLTYIPLLSTIKIYIGETVIITDSRKRSTRDNRSASRSKVGEMGHKVFTSFKKVTVEDCCTKCRDSLGIS